MSCAKKFRKIGFSILIAFPSQFSSHARHFKHNMGSTSFALFLSLLNRKQPFGHTCTQNSQPKHLLTLKCITKFNYPPAKNGTNINPRKIIMAAPANSV